MHEPLASPTLFSPTLSNKLGLSLPNPAPDVEFSTPAVVVSQPTQTVPIETVAVQEPKKKKYAKEAWPGKKPAMSNLLV